METVQIRAIYLVREGDQIKVYVLRGDVWACVIEQPYDGEISHYTWSGAIDSLLKREEKKAS